MVESKFKILVAMSGGVDSSVSAAILTEKGYDVIGVMMRLWHDPLSDNKCCTPDSMASAQKVARQLGIPFHIVDAREAFRNLVVQYFVDGYKKGATPNPCVHCNRYFRWNKLMDKAIEFGATHIATGHYARVRTNENGERELLRGVDPLKDQSYVLHGLSQEFLSTTIFPIGGYTKTEIRSLARQHNLSVAEVPDSQDLCFVGKDGYRDFLVRTAPEVLRPGPISTRDGKILGQHQGLAFYTIGQRKGLRIPASKPYYVFSKNTLTNTLYICNEEELGSLELIAGNVNWISNFPPSKPFNAYVNIRYKSKSQKARVTPMPDNQVRVNFDIPIRDITPGQAVVFYSGQVCLGGGTILPN